VKNQLGTGVLSTIVIFVAVAVVVAAHPLQLCPPTALWVS